jgi:hypothetical protein
VSAEAERLLCERRLLDGLDRATLANIEELTERIPTEERSAAPIEWFVGTRYEICAWRDPVRASHRSGHGRADDLWRKTDGVKSVTSPG